MFFFLANINSNGLVQAIRNNIVAKKTTEIVILFHKKTTKSVFLWLILSQKSIKMLTYILYLISTLHISFLIYNILFNFFLYFVYKEKVFNEILFHVSIFIHSLQTRYVRHATEGDHFENFFL